MRRPLTLLAAALCAAAAPAAARAQYLSTLTYSVSFPTGDTKDFVDNDSWIGVNFEGQRFISPTVSAGLSFGFNEFYHRENSTIQITNGATTGESYRHLNVFPILVTAHFYPNRHSGRGYGEARTLPYAMLGAGTYFIRQVFDFGVFEFTEDAWHFGLAPEIGILVPLQRGGAATLNARYNYPFEAGNYTLTGKSSFNFWSINLGVAYVP